RACDAGGQDHRLAQRGHAGAVGLLGDPACLEDEFAGVSEIGLNAMRLGIGHGASVMGSRPSEALEGGYDERREVHLRWAFRLSCVSRPSGLRGRIKNKTTRKSYRNPRGFRNVFRVVTRSTDRYLLADAQALDQRLIAGRVGGLEELQQPRALADHHEQAAPRGEVLLVNLQV